MTLRLFPPDARTFVGHGIGTLSEAQSATVSWVLNGAYTLVVQYPVNGRRFRDLAYRCIIYSSVGPGGRAQPFRIYRIEQTMVRYVTIYARHIAYDLMGATVVPFSADGLAAALSALQSGSVTEPHEFSFSSEFDSSVVMTVSTPRSIWSLLGGQAGSVLDVYGRGEWDMDGFSLTLRDRLGADRSVSIGYGKNLLSLVMDGTVENVCTGVQPYWEGADGTIVTLPEKVVAVPPPEGEWGFSAIRILDLSTEWADPPTEAQLRARTERYITDNDVGVPSVSTAVNWIPLSQTEEFRSYNIIDDVHMGDTLHITIPTSIDQTTGLPVGRLTMTARATSIVWKPLLERYDHVGAGRVKSGLAAAIARALLKVR